MAHPNNSQAMIDALSAEILLLRAMLCDVTPSLKVAEMTCLSCRGSTTFTADNPAPGAPCPACQGRGSFVFYYMGPTGVSVMDLIDENRALKERLTGAVNAH